MRQELTHLTTKILSALIAGCDERATSAQRLRRCTGISFAHDRVHLTRLLRQRWALCARSLKRAVLRLCGGKLCMRTCACYWNSP